MFVTLPITTITTHAQVDRSHAVIQVKRLASRLLTIALLAGCVSATGCGRSGPDIQAPENPQPLTGPNLQADPDRASKRFDE